MSKKDLSKAKVSLVNASRDIPIKTKVEVDGVVYGAVRIRQMRAVEVGVYIEKVLGWINRSDEEKGEAPGLEIFSLVPETAGFPALDDLSASDLEIVLTDDDLALLDKAVVDFLPSRLRRAEAPTPASGGGTSPTSQQASAPQSETSNSSGGETSSNTSSMSATSSTPAPEQSA